VRRFLDGLGSIVIPLAFVIAALAGIDGGLKW
jgi:hypothetical protein